MPPILSKLCCAAITPAQNLVRCEEDRQQQPIGDREFVSFNKSFKNLSYQRSKSQIFTGFDSGDFKFGDATFRTIPGVEITKADRDFLTNSTPSSSSDALPSDLEAGIIPAITDRQPAESTLLRHYFAELLVDHSNAFRRIGTGNTVQCATQQLRSSVKSDRAVKCEETDLEPGTLADFKEKYEIQRGKMKGIEDLGEGAFGSVMRCVHKESKAKRAVKIGDNEDKRSNQIWKKLGRHSHIVELIEHFEDKANGTQLAVMTLCYGVDLCEWFINSLETEGMTPPITKVMKLFQQMCESVEHCHKAGILHRDLKLENFLFETVSESKVRLCDFGAVYEIEKAKENPPKNLVGTLSYLAPECITDLKYTEKSDIYSLGVILFVLISGCFPYSIDENKVQTRKFNYKIKWDIVKKHKGSLKELLRGMLESDPEKRWDLSKVIEEVNNIRSTQRLRQKSIAAEDDMEVRIAKTTSEFFSSGLRKSKRKGRYKNLAENEILFTEGEKIDTNDLLIIQKGKVEVSKSGVFITTLREGSVLGEMSLLLNQTDRTATVKAVGEGGAQLLYISSEDVAEESGARLRPLAEMATKRLNQVETITYLSKALPDSDAVFLKELADTFEEFPVMYHPKTFLFKEGMEDEERSVFFVRSGEIEILSGQERVATVLSGAMIGEMAALLAFVYPDIYGSMRRSASARSLGHVECNQLSWAVIDEILEAYPLEREKLIEKAKARHEENLKRISDGGEPGGLKQKMTPGHV